MLKVLKPGVPTLVSSSVAEPSTADPTSAWAVNVRYAAGQTVYVAANHRNYECLQTHEGSAEATIVGVALSIATACLVTCISLHGLHEGAAVTITSTGALPTGLMIGVTYYIKYVTDSTFNLATQIGGVAITTTGTQTGTHTIKVQSTAPADRLAGDMPLWLDLGPTNRHAMFDSMSSTQSALTTSAGTPAMVVVVAPGICNGVAVLDVAGVASVTCTMTNGAATVYTETKGVDNTLISNWYEYFFEPYDVYTDLLFGPLPPYPSATVTLTFTPTAVGAIVKCGAALYGNTVEIGDVQYGATAGITDYSRKETDEYGITTLVERGFSKRTSYTISIGNSQLRRVYSTLAALRATPAVWVATDDYKFTPLNAFGYPADWGINVQYADYSTVNLDIEGML